MQNPIDVIRPMTHEEVAIAVDWAAREGWNPGLHDADCFYAADPTGFLVGLCQSEPIATISAVKYGSSYGFIGFYIVKPEYRGQGAGLQIWNAALDYLADRTIGLDGVVAQQENYKKSGFQLAHRNIRYGGVSNAIKPSVHLHSQNIVPVSTLPFETIAAYDRAFFPDDRTRFLRCWLNQPDSVALAILHNGQLAGYGVLRACHNGYRIGPLFADRPDLAEPLFLALQLSVGTGTPIYLDVPEINLAAVQLAERYQMTRVFETARMYRWATQPVHNQEFVDRVFGITTFELG